MRKRRILLGAMGRANRASQPAKSMFRVHYRKLHDDYERQQHKFMPSLPHYVSYCCCRCGHTQQVNAEELNSIVSNALRMAYVAQLQRRPAFQDVIASKSSQNFRRDKQEHSNSWNKQSVEDSAKIGNSVRLASSNWCFASERTGLSAADMSLQFSSSSSPSLRLCSVKTPNSIPGLVPSESVLEDKNGEKSASEQSTPSSDESNSPTELNCYKKFSEKPALIKRLAMGFGRDVLGLACDDDVCPLVSQRSSPSSPNRPHSGGYINEAIVDSDPPRPPHTKLSESLDNNINSLTANDLNLHNNRITNCATENDLKSHNLADGSTHGSTPTPPPPLPERTDSLSSRTEETELRQAPWFQAGIPREITLEVLSQEPEGAFMVRESTSKPGCYALSLRVPREFQPSGIAHYLIMRTVKGFKIKGFTKEFTSLTALITHHSVMPELLPCPLSLSRYNPSFVKSDLNKDFADIDSDSDYNTLTDFRKMMADLNV